MLRRQDKEIVMNLRILFQFMKNPPVKRTYILDSPSGLGRELGNRLVLQIPVALPGIGMLAATGEAVFESRKVLDSRHGVLLRQFILETAKYRWFPIFMSSFN